MIERFAEILTIILFVMAATVLVLAIGVIMVLWFNGSPYM